MACVAGVPHEAQSSLFCLYLVGCVAGVPHDALASLLVDVNDMVVSPVFLTKHNPLIDGLFRCTNANAIVICC